MTPGHIPPPPGGPSSTDVRPLVGRDRRPMPPWLIGVLAVLGGVLLFTVLEGQRQARIAPTVEVRAVDRVSMPAALPPLYITSEPMIPPPPPPPPAALLEPAPYVAEPPRDVPASSYVPTPPSQPIYSPSPPPSFSPPQEPPMGHSSGDTLVIDTTRGAASARAVVDGGQPAGGEANPAPSPALPSARRSTQLGRRANTIPQGALIPAVLETALDSTRPGQVRALVTRDVAGFDGSRVLIPRGSKLFGEYQADLSPGQNRAFVQWTRLVRPDGASIAIASPAADRLGRAGVRGRVDSHFLERFGSAVLQSTLNLGLGWAGRSLGSDTSVVIALPGSSQGGGSAVAGSSQIRPTLRVDAGVTVTVFVAQDLELPAVRDGRQ